MARERDTRILSNTRNCIDGLTGERRPKTANPICSFGNNAPKKPETLTLRPTSISDGSCDFHLPIVIDRRLPAERYLVPICEDLAENFHSFAERFEFFWSEVIEMCGKIGDAPLASLLQYRFAFG